MSVLSRNVNAAYPQKIFEVGRIYRRQSSKFVEESHLAALVAHSSSSYSEAKMYLEPLIRERMGAKLTTPAGTHWAFVRGEVRRDSGKRE